MVGRHWGKSILFPQRLLQRIDWLKIRAAVRARPAAQARTWPVDVRGLSRACGTFAACADSTAGYSRVAGNSREQPGLPGNCRVTAGYVPGMCRVMLTGSRVIGTAGTAGTAGVPGACRVCTGYVPGIRDSRDCRAWKHLWLAAPPRGCCTSTVCLEIKFLFFSDDLFIWKIAKLLKGKNFFERKNPGNVYFKW